MAKLEISSIVLDPKTQPRCALDETVIDSYVQSRCDGEDLGPVQVFNDGTRSWLADGHYRIEAARRLGDTTIEAVVASGTWRDAFLFGLRVNSRHGQALGLEDKRRAVRAMLGDEEWGQYTSSALAKMAHCSVDLVERIRLEVQPSPPQNQTAADGRVFKRRAQPNGLAQGSILNPQPTPADDEDGDALPDRVRPAFDRKREFRNATAMLDTFLASVRSLVQSPAGVYISVGAIERAVQQLKEQVALAAPYRACPQCSKGVMQDCPSCKDSCGWVDRTRWEMIKTYQF